MPAVVYLSDLIDTRPVEPMRLTLGERRDFIKEIEREMVRLGFDKANELTSKSTLLTAKDYNTTINY